MIKLSVLTLVWNNITILINKISLARMHTNDGHCQERTLTKSSWYNICKHVTWQSAWYMLRRQLIFTGIWCKLIYTHSNVICTYHVTYIDRSLHSKDWGSQVWAHGHAFMIIGQHPTYLNQELSHSHIVILYVHSLYRMHLWMPHLCGIYTRLDKTSVA